MEQIVLSTGSFKTNTYLLIEGKEVLIIDPGDDAEYIIETITQKKLTPIAILVTHGHFDHAMGAWQVQKFFNIPFYIHPKDQFLLDRILETAIHFLGNVPAIAPEKISYLKIPNIPHFPDFTFQIIETPGHTPGSVSYYFPSENKIFSGDLIFKDGVHGRTDFSYCSEVDIKISISKILHLPTKSQIFPGHGDSTNISAEKDFYFT